MPEVRYLQITAEFFVGQRYRKMEDQKPWPGLALNQEFFKRRALKPKLKNENI